MDGSFVITWKELLLFGIIVLAVYIAELLLLMGSGKSLGLRFWRRREERQDLAAIKTRLAMLEARLAKLEAAGSTTEDMEIVSTPYGKAFTLAKQGMDVAQVALSCGISRAEAELIVAMQHNRLH
ncbi:MAG: DUF2802 domain-containing protein [Burkholderiales bacterium]